MKGWSIYFFLLYGPRSPRPIRKGGRYKSHNFPLGHKALVVVVGNFVTDSSAGADVN